MSEATATSEFHKRNRRDYDPDIDFLLNEAPSLLGEKSGQGATAAAIERGVSSGGTIADNGPHHDAAISAIESVGRARRLDEIWLMLDAGTRQVLRARYLKRSHWPTGCLVFLTSDLVGVAMLLSPDRKELEKACQSAAKNASAKAIQRDRKLAERAVVRAHEDWDAAKRKRAKLWAEGGKS
jgi:hypothetical protein